MTAWDIDPAGVQGVLGKTQSVAAEFEGQLASMTSALESGATNTSSEIVASAIQGFGSAIEADVRFVLSRTGAAISGCAAAVNAYAQGDLEMAANAQRNAAGATVADMPGRGPR
jgi:Family of unknown function (DUF6507)